MAGPGRPSNASRAAAEAIEDDTKTLVTSEDIDGTVLTSNDELARIKAELEALRAEKAEREARDRGEYGKPQIDEDGNFVIHFVANGLTLLGKIYYIGQELLFNVNEQSYKDTLDITGFSCLELRNNPEAQRQYLGKHYFSEGRWNGKSYADIEFERLQALAGEEDIDLPTRDDLKRLDEQERKRLNKAESLIPFPEEKRRPRGY